MGGRSSPAHTAAQLVQLRQTKALSVIDQHHRRVGNIHANLHHRCRHQELGLPAAETVLPAAFRRYLADHVVGPLANQGIPRAAGGCAHQRPSAQVQLFGFLHQGQHHIGLAAFVDLLANQLIRLGPLG